ncbi:MAG: GNAT family N-acetyltransferase [Rhizobacter sp.]|nr:GNAT family N-acetyltransferase [Bacteriovorax sp.]
MEKFNFITAKNKSDLVRFYPIMKELRPELSYADYLNIYEEAHAKDGYEIVGVESGSHIFAVMGYRVLVDYVHGRHLYIDDLVSTAAQRSKGYGAKLLAYAEEVSKELGCKSLRLCTGIDNEKGQKFYEREGWELKSLVYKKKLTPSQ